MNSSPPTHNETWLEPHSLTGFAPVRTLWPRRDGSSASYSQTYVTLSLLLPPLPPSRHATAIRRRRAQTTTILSQFPSAMAFDLTSKYCSIAATSVKALQSPTESVWKKKRCLAINQGSQSRLLWCILEWDLEFQWLHHLEQWWWLLALLEASL